MHGNLALSSWSSRLNNQTQAPVICGVNWFINPRIVVYQSNDAGADAGPDVISYDGVAADVIGRYNGLPAVAFADYPVTV